MVALAGCSSLGILDSPEYEVGNKESLLPDEVGEDWPDQDLEANHDANENFERVWTTPDEELVVFMGARIYESVEAAEEEFESAEATASDPGEYPLADEAFISDNGEFATCFFRHSNAAGQVVSARQSGLEIQPDRQRATNYAERLYESWG
jgi:hypothetical protein